jgi:hypothetical protein
MQDLIPLVVRGLIVTIILLAVLAVGYAVFGGTAASNAVSQINALESAVQSSYSGQADFTGLACATGNACASISSGIPSNLMTSGGVLGTDSWGGNITIATASPPLGGGTATSDFTVAFAAVPQAACTQVGDQLSGYASLTIGGTTFTPNTTNAANPTTVATACAGAANTVTVNYARG